MSSSVSSSESQASIFTTLSPSTKAFTVPLPAADSPRRVLLLDFWSDRNRGDAAMQIALIRLLRRELSRAELTIMAAFGTNQWPEFANELDESGGLADDLVG